MVIYFPHGGDLELAGIALCCSGLLIIGNSLAMTTIRPFLQKRHFPVHGSFSLPASVRFSSLLFAAGPQEFRGQYIWNSDDSIFNDKSGSREVCHLPSCSLCSIFPMGIK
jgi:hypothetical protein